MKIIRKNVFETNSSSSHSIVISNKENKTMKFPRKSNDVFKLDYVAPSCCDSSSDYEFLTTEVSKAGYLLCIIASYLEYGADEDIIDFEKVRTLTFNDIYEVKQFKWLKELIEEETDTVIEFEPNSRRRDSFPFYPVTYDDESDITELFCFDWEDENSFKIYMKDIIFNPNIGIIDKDEIW